MAGVPAINGLYVAFFQIIIYCITGTSKHISVGTFAIISLMSIAAVNKYDGILYGTMKNETNQTTNYLDEDPASAKLKITTVLCLAVGLFHIIFSILHLGVITKYLSDSIVNGFICGAAYQTVFLVH